MGRALLLNASFEPLCILPVRRAVVLLLKERAEVIADTDVVLHSERAAIAVPSVLRLRQYVRVPHRTRVPLSRRALFARDEHRCQYCGRAAENIDHVIPRSRGGAHVWENVVASCRPCNAKKEDRLPGEIGFTLRRPPAAPQSSVWLLAHAGRVDPTWLDWIPEHGRDRIPA